LLIYNTHIPKQQLSLYSAQREAADTVIREQIADASYCCLFRSSILSWRILSGTQRICACHAFCVAPL